MECKFCDEFTGVCINADCPMCADLCPVPDIEEVCSHEQREEVTYKLTPKGCALFTLKDAGLVESSIDPTVDVFWESFSALIEKFGYVEESQS